MDVVGLPRRTASYLRDVQAELRKVTWPSVEDLRKSTTVIIIFLIVMGLLIGIIDWLWSVVLINWLGRAFG